MKLVTNSFFYRKARKERAKDAKNKYFDFNSLRSLRLSQKKLVPFLFPINIFILFLSLMGKVPKGIGVGKCRRQKGLGELKGAFTPLRLKNLDFLRSYCLKVLCLSVFCLTVSFATAQTSIKYTYDDSGNRTHRTIVMKSPEQTPPPQDSTETVIDEEDPFPPLFKKRQSFRTSEATEESVEYQSRRLTLDCFTPFAMTAVAYLRHAVVAGNGFSTNITSLRDERDGLRLLKKQIRPERAQSKAYGNAIRENIRQTLSPERAQSIRCQAFSLRHAMITIFGSWHKWND